jgi:hypothetical protein
LPNAQPATVTVLLGVAGDECKVSGREPVLSRAREGRVDAQARRHVLDGRLDGNAERLDVRHADRKAPRVIVAVAQKIILRHFEIASGEGHVLQPLPGQALQLGIVVIDGVVAV